MNIYNSNTYGKDLRWLYFDNEPAVQERQQGKDQQSCKSAFVAYLIIPRSNREHHPRHDNSIPPKPHGKFIERQNNLGKKKLHRRNQGSNLLGGTFSN